MTNPDLLSLANLLERTEARLNDHCDDCSPRPGACNQCALYDLAHDVMVAGLDCREMIARGDYITGGDDE